MIEILPQSFGVLNLMLFALVLQILLRWAILEFVSKLVSNLPHIRRVGQTDHAHGTPNALALWIG